MDVEEIKKFLDKNSNYWEQRAIGNTLLAAINEEDYNKRLEAIYKQGSKDIEEKFAKFYSKFATNNNLTLEEAKKMLPTSIATEYKQDLNDYIAKAKSGDPKYYNYLLNQSVMHRYTALNTVQTEFREVIQNLDSNNTMEMYLNKSYQNSNYYNSFITDTPFTKVSQEKFEALLNENWSGGGNFSSNIWKNKEQLVQALDDIVITGLATGQSYNKMAEQLAKRMDTSKSNAKRLIMTESARIDNQGLLNQYKEMGVEQYVIVATLDTKTSEICQALDGQVFNMEEAQVGITMPPFHPYCRTTFAPYYEDNITERAYRDKDTDKTVISDDYSNYEQYLEKHLGDAEKAKALASTKNTLGNLLNAVTQITNIKKAISTSALTIANGDSVSISNSNAVSELSNSDLELIETIQESLEDINAQIVEGLDLSEETEKMIKEVDELLSKMEYYNNSVGISVEGDNPLEGMTINEIYENNTFMNGSKETNSSIIIQSKTGKDVQYYSNDIDSDLSVIFSRNSKFIINDIQTVAGEIVYYLEEII